MSQVDVHGSPGAATQRSKSKPRRLPGVSREAITENIEAAQLVIDLSITLLERRDHAGLHLRTCNHGYWLGNTGLEGHDTNSCLGSACPKEGSPCSKRCFSIRRAACLFGISEGVVL